MVLLYDPLLIDNGAIVADAFQCHQVTFGDVGGIEPDAGMPFFVSFHLRIPIERRAMVRARLIVENRTQRADCSQTDVR